MTLVFVGASRDKRHLVEIAIDTFEGGLEDRRRIHTISDLMYGLIDHREMENKEN